MTPSRVLLALLLSLLTPPLMAATEEELMDELFGLMPGTAVEHCSVAAPELRPQLEAESRQFNEKLRREIQPFLKELLAEGATHPGVPKDQLDRLKKQMLIELGKVDAARYCQGLISKLQTVDAAALASAARNQYLNYLEAARQKHDKP